MKDLTKNIGIIDRASFSQGGFGTLYKARLYSDNSQESEIVAVKFPNLHSIETFGDPGNINDKEKVLRRWKREIKAGQGVSHPNILPFLGFCSNPDAEYREFIGLVLPFCINRDASVYVRGRPHTDRMRILKEVGAALFALHSANPPVVHGDIKAQNILIDSEGHALLADFGLSRICETSGFTTDSLMDIWAFSMTILQILTGELPFNELKKDCVILLEVVINARRPKRPSDFCITDGLWTLLEHCWHQDASARPDARHVGLALDLISRKIGGELNSRTISEILKGHLDSSATHSRRLESTTLPYKCKWLRCAASFNSLDNCIVHECSEFLEQKACT
ncbi:kinase-like protein [Fomitiporia mediterranea MF3/22]|uniref:kinase-like protein n=1 Tax=Fomitiporia mediterranea (strain MF3/22) TaxID=694068 RepID=UPI0004408826|nr:kinase-like protein [Fomitiporia mediterranea MF3/22]EJD07032.1 kinase-like protein [Fomitiporia mediterranea MF3/22]